MTDGAKKIIMIADTNETVPHNLADMLKRDSRFGQADIRVYKNFPDMYRELNQCIAADTLPAAIVVDDTHTSRMKGDDMMNVIRKEKPELNTVPVYFLASQGYHLTQHPQATLTFFREQSNMEALAETLHHKTKSQAERLGKPGKREGLQP